MTAEKDGQINALRHKLKRLIFAAKSERFVPNGATPEQLDLGFELQSSKAEAKKQTEQITVSVKRKKPILVAPLYLIIFPFVAK